jgi:hypothetical protein
MVFAIGFNRVFRDERLPTFGFSIRTVFTITAPGRKGGIFPFTLGIGFTAVGMTNHLRVDAARKLLVRHLTLTQLLLVTHLAFLLQTDF